MTARDLADLDVVALMVDGVHVADACCVVALAITADGTKVPVGLWSGDTENTTVVTHLLADLVGRGLDTSGGLLVVIDGAKALAAGVHKVFGDQALVQRCTLHKRRNVKDHLPKDQGGFVDRKLAQAFANPDPDAGLRAAKDLARALERASIPTRPPACVRDSRRCSPSGASVSVTASPRRSRTRTRSSR